MISLTSAISSKLEPMRKNRWAIQFTTIPGGDAAQVNALAFCAHTSGIPNAEIAVTEMNRLHEKFYVAGRPTHGNLPMSFYDYMNANSPAQIIYNWYTNIYNPITGQQGFKQDYSTTATLAQLDPLGGVIRVWNLFYVWPSTFNYGDTLSYDDDGLLDINITLNYDFAIKGTDIDTTPTAQSFA